jgi:chromosome partitioning protein
VIISVQNQKGGVGKTTLAIHLSHALQLQNKKNTILLIDADPQGSARDWAAARSDEPPFTVIAIDRPVLHREIPKLAPNYTHIIIDGPPRASELARSAISAADFVLIPVQPSPYDVWAAQDIINLIKEATVFKENLKSAFAINRKIVNTAIGRDVSEALTNFEIPILKSQICQRVVFAESAATGQTVLETAPKSAAAKEIKAIAKEILTME